MSTITPGMDKPVSSETPATAPVKPLESVSSTQSPVDEKTQETWAERIKRIMTFGGSVVNEAQNAPQSLNPRSTTPPATEAKVTPPAPEAPLS